jgi:hypothetical protein
MEVDIAHNYSQKVVDVSNIIFAIKIDHYYYLFFIGTPKNRYTYLEDYNNTCEIACIFIDKAVRITV